MNDTQITKCSNHDSWRTKVSGLVLVLLGFVLIIVNVVVQPPDSWVTLWYIALEHLKGNVPDLSRFIQVNRIAWEAAIRNLLLLVAGVGLMLLRDRLGAFVPRRNFLLVGGMVFLCW